MGVQGRRSYNRNNDVTFGQEGSIFTNTNTIVEAPNELVIIAIQFLADTTFDALIPDEAEFNSYDNGICVGSEAGDKGLGKAANLNTVNRQGTGGQIINAASAANLTVFPKGLIIYGRWESFTIDADPDGGVIAYLGY